MSETTQPPQITEKVDLRKIMTPEKEERLRHAREVRARNRLMREEKRMEVAKQFLMASAGAPESKTTKSNPEEKKLKWETRKNELVAEIRQILLSGKRAPEQPKESDSEFSEIETEPPVKKPKREKKSKHVTAAAKPKKTKKSSSHSAASGRSEKKRKPVKTAVMSDDSNEEESSGMSEVEQHNVLQLW